MARAGVFRDPGEKGTGSKGKIAGEFGGTLIEQRSKGGIHDKFKKKDEGYTFKSSVIEKHLNGHVANTA